MKVFTFTEMNEISVSVFYFGYSLWLENDCFGYENTPFPLAIWLALVELKTPYL